MELTGKAEFLGTPKPVYENSYIIYDLKGKSLSNPLGDQGIVLFEAKTKEIEEMSERRKVNIYVTTCYLYETQSTSSVCIDTDVYNIKDIYRLLQTCLYWNGLFKKLRIRDIYNIIEVISYLIFFFF